MLKRVLLYLILLLAVGTLSAQTKVTLEQLQQNWSRYQGQRVTITTPLIVCGKYYDSLIVSSERLFVPEERAVGLGQGDSTTYWYWRHYNDSLRIKLQCRTGFNLNLGATVKNLTAQVMGPRSLQTGAQPRFKNYKPSKNVKLAKPAKPAKPALTICAANIQNYFVHVGGYATKRNTPGQHQWQCEKTAAALTRINADIYALCELEQGSSAPAELCARMNSLCRKDKYTYVVTDTMDRDTISVGFIYNKARVRPHEDLIFVYNENLNNIYAHRFMIQSFEDISTGQSFYMSLNHPRSKRGDPAEANAKRVASITRVLAALDTLDAPIILVGDYNAYGQEQSLQMLVNAGYKDMVMAMDSLNYSYSYNGECGYLDRVFANEPMQGYITSIQPIHWNTDYYYSAAYWNKYNYKNNIPPKDKQENIWKCVSSQAKKNLLFRYSDHDPLLIMLNF